MILSILYIYGLFMRRWTGGWSMHVLVVISPTGIMNQTSPRHDRTLRARASAQPTHTPSHGSRLTPPLSGHASAAPSHPHRPINACLIDYQRVRSKTEQSELSLVHGRYPACVATSHYPFIRLHIPSRILSIDRLTALRNTTLSPCHTCPIHDAVHTRSHC